MAQADCHSISSLIEEEDRFINSLNSAKAIILVCVFTLQTENPCAKASATALYQAWELLDEAGAAQIALDKMRPAERTTASVSPPVRSNTLDPVLLTIEDYKVACAETNRAITVWSNFEDCDDSPAKRKAEAALDRAGNKKNGALYRLVTTKATTLDGLAEVATFLGAPRPLIGTSIYETEHCRWDETVEGNATARPKMYFATLAAALHDIAARTEAGGAS